MNFIKRVFEGGADEGVHRQFVRFGKGEYNGRAVLRLRKTKNIKIKSSFEFANDFVRLCLEFNADNYKVFGIILSKKKFLEKLSKSEDVLNATPTTFPWFWVLTRERARENGNAKNVNGLEKMSSTSWFPRKNL